jgi:hypothetical protein
MSRQKTVRNPITSEEVAILDEVHKDPFLFSHFIYCIHPIRGKVKFKLYPYQMQVLDCFLSNRFNIIKKFRQGGITELIAMYCLWFAMYHPNKNIVIISIKDRVAKKVLKRIKFMYKNLPLFLQVPVVNGRGTDIGTVTELEFCNGSMIASIPTTEDAGRSDAVSLMVIDEGAIVRWANQIWASAFPTLSTGGSAIINSTPFGVGNWYHGMWVEACNGTNGFCPINLKWQMHPERDLKWYHEQRNILGVRRTAQEIDGDFLSSGNNVFDLSDIRAIEDSLVDYQPIEIKFGGNLRIYKKPEPGKIFSLGSDVSTGQARDYSAFSILDREGEEYASFKGKIKPTALADLMMDIGRDYNFATLAPESNDIGLAVTSKIEAQGYPKLYYSTQFLKEKGERKHKEQPIAGWYTTSKNRPVIINSLEEDIRYDNIIIKDPFFVQEAYTFIYNEENKPIAMGKNRKSNSADDAMDDNDIYHDDSIMGKAITNHVRKARVTGPLVLPK